MIMCRERSQRPAVPHRAIIHFVVGEGPRALPPRGADIPVVARTLLSARGKDEGGQECPPHGEGCGADTPVRVHLLAPIVPALPRAGMGPRPYERFTPFVPIVGEASTPSRQKEP